MIYRAIGIMSGSSLDGLDIAFAEFTETSGKWDFQIPAAACYPYPQEWEARLTNAVKLNAQDYLLLHTQYGKYIGEQVVKFINENNLHYKTGLISSHGHTTFHLPHARMTAQLGDGAAIAAETGLPVVTELRALDVAFGGQGAPIVPMGEKLLFSGYDYFLNIGGIANVSIHHENYTAFDVCPANRVLNLLSNDMGMAYDADGKVAASAGADETLLQMLNGLPFYKKAPPKSLANDFGTDEIYPLLKNTALSTAQLLSTYTEHIAVQAASAVAPYARGGKMLVTGGGAFNKHLVARLQHHLAPHNIEVVIPDAELINYKEALIMALLGVLRWREEYTTLPTVTGAARASIGGALWLGQEA